MSDVLEYLKLDEDTDLEDTDIKIWQVGIRQLDFCREKLYM